VLDRDGRKALALGIGEAGADDIVLIAGKGHETYQEVAGIKHPFDDRLVARELLEGKA
jgi:UDP-N-acetylmuramoyl-L-alanyl-D-glutamate--2,6-diaminopimelate ligase